MFVHNKVIAIIFTLITFVYFEDLKFFSELDFF